MSNSIRMYIQVSYDLRDRIIRKTRDGDIIDRCSDVCEGVGQQGAPYVCSALLDATKSVCSAGLSPFCQGLIQTVSTSCNKMVSDIQQYCAANCKPAGGGGQNKKGYRPILLLPVVSGISRH